MGYYGAPNYGDEIMLQVLLSKLLSQEKVKQAYEITVMVERNPRIDIFQYPDVKIIGYPKSVPDINFLARYFDAMIIGGGCLIDDINYDCYNRELPLLYTIPNLSLRMEEFGKKVIWYGLSCTQELVVPEYIERLKKVINRIEYISLRDKNSLKPLVDCGVGVEKIKIVDDIAFAGADPDSYKKPAQSKKICLIYIYYGRYYEELKAFTQKILKWTENDEERLVCIPFFEPEKNDTEFYRRLKNDLESDRLIVEKMPRNIREFAQLVGDAETVISMRYHGTLLANYLGCNVINLKNDVHPHYNNKVDYLYDFYGFRNKEILFSKLNEVDEDEWTALISEAGRNSVDCGNIYRRANKAIDEMIRNEL